MTTLRHDWESEVLQLVMEQSRIITMTNDILEAEDVHLFYLRFKREWKLWAEGKIEEKRQLALLAREDDNRRFEFSPWAVLVHFLDYHPWPHMEPALNKSYIDTIAYIILRSMPRRYCNYNSLNPFDTDMTVSPLLFALQSKWVNIAKHIAVEGKGSLFPGEQGAMVMTALAEYDNLKYVLPHLKRKLDLSAVNRRLLCEEGGTALHGICRNTMLPPQTILDSVQALVAIGVKPHLRDDNLMSPRDILWKLYHVHMPEGHPLEANATTHPSILETIALLERLEKSALDGDFRYNPAIRMPNVPPAIAARIAKFIFVAE